MFARLRQRNEWKFFSVLPKTDFPLACAWWAALILRGLLPANFALAMGFLVGAVEHGTNLFGPLALAGVLLGAPAAPEMAVVA